MKKRKRAFRSDAGALSATWIDADGTLADGGVPWLTPWHTSEHARLSSAYQAVRNTGVPRRVDRVASRSDEAVFDIRLTAAPSDELGRVLLLREPAAATTASDANDKQTHPRFEQGLAVLAATGTAFFEDLRFEQTLKNITRSLIESFATFCFIDIINDRGIFERIACSHRNAEIEASQEFQNPRLPDLPRTHFFKRAVFDGESSVAIADDAWYERAAYSEERANFLRSLGFDSVICVPIPGHDGRIYGALSCGLNKADAGRHYDEQDLPFMHELARRAGAAIGNARIYEREQRIALNFQEAALPRELPRIPGLHISAEYRPGQSEATIGGDWYDAFALDDGRVAFVVGDVVGNGLQAAVVMSKLRQAMQTAALIHTDPNFILDAGDRMLRTCDRDLYATALVAIYDPLDATMLLASAGHPLPFLVDADGCATQISGGGLMLGLRTPGEECETVRFYPGCGSMLFFFTDGLIETTRDAEEGLSMLGTALAERDIFTDPAPTQRIVDKVLGGAAAEDDLAVLAVRIDGIERPCGFTLRYHDAQLAHDARRLFAQWLRRCGGTRFDIAAAELVLGELLGNVARHAPGRCRIEVDVDVDRLYINVYDEGAGYELERPTLPVEFSESKRGLFLIDAFARSIAVAREGNETKTSVVMDARA